LQIEEIEGRMKEHSYWRSNEDKTDAEYSGRQEVMSSGWDEVCPFLSQCPKVEKSYRYLIPNVLKIRFGMMVCDRVRGRKRQNYHVQDGISTPEVQIDNLYSERYRNRKTSYSYFG
jgi:hypothetical protein